jgi:hypothetical protein
VPERRLHPDYQSPRVHVYVLAVRREPRRKSASGNDEGGDDDDGADELGWVVGEPKVSERAIERPRARVSEWGE